MVDKTMPHSPNRRAAMARLEQSPHWTIKNMPVETRQKAVNAASSDGQSVVQFVTEVVLLLIDKRAGRYVLPPSPSRRQKPGVARVHGRLAFTLLHRA